MARCEIEHAFYFYYQPFWAGLIDQVEVYDRALSAGEIKAVFDAGKCKADHFLCYKAKTTTGTTKVDSREVSLDDQFEEGSLLLKSR